MPGKGSDDIFSSSNFSNIKKDVEGLARYEVRGDPTIIRGRRYSRYSEVNTVNLAQKYRPNGIHVSNLSAQLWCEKQLLFRLELGEVETKRMQTGKERHKELHEEITTIKEVHPKSIEDYIAMRLYNCRVGLGRLKFRSMTRELYVWGRVNSLSVNGIIDELILENGKLVILDTKTRGRDSPPSLAQKRTTRFQLMLYKHLFDSIKTGRFTHKQLMEFYNLNKKSKVTRDFQKEMSRKGFKIEPNIDKFSKEVFCLFGLLPEVSNDLQIRYEYKNTGNLICTDEFRFDPQMFERDCNFVEEFWIGKRGAVPVGERNRWKCKFCEHEEICAKS